jgi:hypothetical protein
MWLELLQWRKGECSSSLAELRCHHMPPPPTLPVCTHRCNAQTWDSGKGKSLVALREYAPAVLLLPLCCCCLWEISASRSWKYSKLWNRSDPEINHVLKYFTLLKRWNRHINMHEVFCNCLRWFHSLILWCHAADSLSQDHRGGGMVLKRWCSDIPTWLMQRLYTSYESYDMLSSPITYAQSYARL